MLHFVPLYAVNFFKAMNIKQGWWRVSLFETDVPKINWCQVQGRHFGGPHIRHVINDKQLENYAAGSGVNLVRSLGVVNLIAEIFDSSRKNFRFSGEISDFPGEKFW